MKLLKPHKVIGPAQNPYMHRWFVFKVGNLPRVYIHKFLRSDDDRALHDHPWWFVSIILRGAYVEVTENDRHKTVIQYRGSLFSLPIRVWPRRTIAYRPATFRHRIMLINNQPVWTLFITGPVIRPWGFWCRHQDRTEMFVPWQQFDGCD